MRHLALIAVSLVVLTSGCSLGTKEGDGKQTISGKELRKLVLQPRDLPRVFAVFDEGAQVKADQPSGSRGDPTRFGREGGWKSRYRRQGTLSTLGPLVIESRADRFKSSSGAKSDLEAIEQRQFKELDKPKLGDHARAWSLHQGPVGQGLRFYLVAWQEDNLTASILINGFEGKMTLEDALSLARKQQQRIAAAARS
jgi:hypothetical protein